MGEDEKKAEYSMKRGELMRAIEGTAMAGPVTAPRAVPEGVIDFNAVMRARRAAQAEQAALDDADALLAKMQSQMHRMQTMLVALAKRDGRIRISRAEIEGVTKSDKLAVRIDQETGTVTLEVMT